MHKFIGVEEVQLRPRDVLNTAYLTLQRSRINQYSLIHSLVFNKYFPF